MKPIIVQCLKDWGYSFNAEGGIPLKDGTTIDIIRPQTMLPLMSRYTPWMCWIMTWLKTFACYVTS